MSIVICHGCHAKFEQQEDLPSYELTGIGRYGVVIPECSAVSCELLHYEQTHFGYPPAHRLLIDTYAVQHPPHCVIQMKLGVEDRLIKASEQSVFIHLLALHCALVEKIELQDIAAVMATVLKNMKAQGIDTNLVELKHNIPTHFGAWTVVDVADKILPNILTLQEYTEILYQWAQQTWDAWLAHHDLIATMYKRYKK